MNKLILILLLLTPPAHGYYFARIGAGVNTTLFNTSDWAGEDQLGCTLGAGHRHHIYNNWYGEISYQHFSHCFLGEPFGDPDDVESSLDTINYYLEYRFGE